MNVTLLLADAAQVSPDGKLHALGIGWSQTSSPLTGASAVAFILHIPWDETNRKIKWTLDLLDADGKAVELETAPGGSTTRIHMENEIEVGRPPGIKPGSDIGVPFAVNVPPMPLKPDHGFVWVLRIGGKEWRTPFSTRPLQSMPPR